MKKAFKLKIAHLVDNVPSFQQPFVWAQILETTNSGHELTVWSRHSKGLDAFPDKAKDLGLHKRWTFLYFSGPVIRRYQAFFSNSCILFFLRFFSALSRIWFFTTHKIYVSWFWPPQSCDIIHCQTGNMGLWACDLMRIGLVKGRLIVSLRGKDVLQIKKASPGQKKELFSKAELFLPVCQSLFDDIVEAGCPPEKCRVLYSAVDTEPFEDKVSYLPGADGLTLLSVCRLVEKKGLSYALDAVAKLSRSGQRVQYHILGDGPCKEKLLEKARHLGIDHMVRFHGQMDRAGVARHMKEADIFLSPSITTDDGDREGIANSLKEAMLVGLPCVATDHGGTKEIITPWENGILVPERDPDALADAVQSLRKQPEAWLKMGELARKTILSYMDSRKLGVKLMEIYGSVSMWT
jgi:colanic acid/amylovoran biosynthesis glycosyltransferase